MKSSDIINKKYKYISVFLISMMLVASYGSHAYASEVVKLDEYADEKKLVEVTLETTPSIETSKDKTVEEAESENAVSDNILSEENSEDMTDNVEDEEDYSDLINKLKDIEEDGSLTINMLTELEYVAELESYIWGENELEFSMERRIMRNDTPVVQFIEEDEEDTLVFMLISEDEIEELEQNIDDENLYEYDDFSYKWPLEKMEMVDAKGGSAKLTIEDEFEGNLYYFIIDENGISSSEYVVRIIKEDTVESRLDELSNEVSENAIAASSNQVEVSENAVGASDNAIDISGNTIEASENRIDESEKDIPDASSNEVDSENADGINSVDDIVDVSSNAIATNINNSEFKELVEIPEPEKNIKDIDKTDKEIICVSVPTDFDIVMLPYEDGSILILSEDIVMKNNGESNLAVMISNVNVTINKDNAASEANKTCELKLTIDDAIGENTLSLVEGDNALDYKAILSGRADAKEAMGNRKEDGNNKIEDKVVLKLNGRIADGSNDLWRNGDLSVSVTYSFSHNTGKEVSENSIELSENAIEELSVNSISEVSENEVDIYSQGAIGEISEDAIEMITDDDATNNIDTDDKDKIHEGEVDE